MEAPTPLSLLAAAAMVLAADAASIEPPPVLIGGEIGVVAADAGTRDMASHDTHRVGHAAQPHQLSGRGVVIGIWDEGGVNTGHVELRGRVEQIDSVPAISQHATHTAGTLIACGKDCAGGSGDPLATGIAPQARILAHDWVNDLAEMRRAATGADGRTPITCSVHAYGWPAGWFLEPPADIYGRRPWNWYGGPQPAGEQARGFGRYGQPARGIDAVAYAHPRLSVFVAAGNHRNKGPAQAVRHRRIDGGRSFPSAVSRPRNGILGGYDTLTGMAMAKNALVIGALADIDVSTEGTDAIASADFSSWGPTDDGRIKPDLVADGIRLWAPSHETTNTYLSSSGTSMSTAVAGGVCALLNELAVRRFRQPLTSAMLKAVLVHTASRPYAGPSLRLGWGSIRADLAAEALAERGGIRLVSGKLDSETQRWQMVAEAPAFQPVRATLAWIDPPGPSEGDAPALVNDLDLRLIDPPGHTHHPWRIHFDPSAGAEHAEQALRDGPNRTDNLERIDVRGRAVAGRWQVIVDTPRRPLDAAGRPADQAFALVIEGLDGEPKAAYGGPPEAGEQTPRPDAKGRGRHALLIGVQDYGSVDRARTLDGPLADVELIAGTLISRLGFRDSEIQRLRDSEATHCAIHRAFRRLAETVAPGDLVYIHFSGHGARHIQRGRRGDEAEHTDETWVPWGARTDIGASADCPDTHPDLNRFDILDDEINAWLAALDATGANVVLVSDACYSGSITRDAAPGLRALPPITDHPLAASDDRPRPLPGVISIGAADDHDLALEDYFSEYHRSHGVFTWYWSRALYASADDDTWHDVFARASVRVRQHRVGHRQRPQMEIGTAGDLTLLGARRTSRPVLTVAAAADGGQDGAVVTIGAGALAGMTEGSVLRAKAAGGPARLRIIAVGAFDSEARVLDGAVQVGDVLVEERHAFPARPLRVLLNAGPAAAGRDAAVIAQLRDDLAQVPGVALTTDRSRHDLELYVLRPVRDADGAPRPDPGGGPLPPPDPGAPAELWLLDRAQRPIAGQQWPLTRAATEHARMLREHLTRYARAAALTRLEPPATGSFGDALLIVRVREPLAAAAAGFACADREPADPAYRNREIRLATGHAQARRCQVPLRRGSCLHFEVRNNDLSPLYAHLLNIAPDGRVRALFPKTGWARQEVRIDAGGGFARTGTDGAPHWAKAGTAGEDIVKLLLTREPVDVGLLETGHSRRGAPGEGLAVLLANLLEPVRSGAVATEPDGWTALQLHLLVGDAEPPDAGTCPGDP